MFSFQALLIPKVRWVAATSDAFRDDMQASLGIDCKLIRKTYNYICSNQ